MNYAFSHTYTHKDRLVGIRLLSSKSKMDLLEKGLNSLMKNQGVKSG